MDLITDLVHSIIRTVWDVLPIVAIVFGFQLFVIRRPIPKLKQVLIGFFYVLIGLALFVDGLEQALFPLGRLMAQQLTDPTFIQGGDAAATGLTTLLWSDYYWVYVFAFAIGFATTIAEPSLLAVAIKASDVSGGTITVWGLRVAVALVIP